MQEFKGQQIKKGACNKLMLIMQIFSLKTRHAEHGCHNGQYFASFGNQLITQDSAINPMIMEAI
jgi:hypothetical protein